MRKGTWLRRLALSAGAIVVVLAVCGLVSCADLLGAGDGGSSDGDSTGGGGTPDVDPTGTWLAVLDAPTGGPTGVDFQAVLADIDDAQVTLIFYGAGTDQVAGLRGPYQVDGNSVTFSMNVGWFDEDPQDPLDDEAPELKEQWAGTDWYEVVEGDVLELSVTFDGTTFTPDAVEGVVYEEVSFSRPVDLVNRWENVADYVELYAGGSFSFAYDDEGTQQTGGGPFWSTSGTSDGFLRQVYDSILLDGDPMALEYWEFLSPYETIDPSTTRIYESFDRDAYTDYTSAE